MIHPDCLSPDRANALEAALDTIEDILGGELRCYSLRWSSLDPDGRRWFAQTRERVDSDELVPSPPGHVCTRVGRVTILGPPAADDAVQLRAVRERIEALREQEATLARRVGGAS